MGLSYDQLFPSRFIKAGEFQGKPVTLTITDVQLEDLETETGATERKAIVSFAETKRQWVLIKTNAQCLLAMWGPDTDDWINHRVTLYPERDASGMSDSGLCIRVQGSPELTKTVTATIKLPRRRPMERKLTSTKKDVAATGLLDFDSETGEIEHVQDDPTDAELDAMFAGDEGTDAR